MCARLFFVAFVFCSLLSSLMPGPLFGQSPRRTLLLEIRDIKENELESALSIFGGGVRDVVISHVRNRALLRATRGEAELLRERGFRVVEVIRDTSDRILYKRALYGESMQLSPAYHTYARIVDELQELARQYPAVIRPVVIGRTSQERREIVAGVITSGVMADEDKPSILFNGCHHADELMGAEICSALMRDLVTRYGTDREVTEWVDHFRIVIVPVVNVDGHTVVTSGIDPRWRKNTRDTNRNGILHEFPEGVDLNRNYDFNWAQGGSGDPSSERYRGPYPFSEEENRAMAALADRERFLLSITYHSQGEVIYYPWDWRGRKAPDDKLLTAIARGLGSSIRNMKGDSCYRAEYGAGTVGQTYPWLYGRFGTFDFVVETGKGAPFFPPEEVAGIVHRNLEGTRYLLGKGKGPGLAVRVIDALTRKPIEAFVWLPALETEDVDRRTTRAGTGRLWRLLDPGTYQVIVAKSGYRPHVHDSVTVNADGWTPFNLSLEPEVH